MFDNLSLNHGTAAGGRCVSALQTRRGLRLPQIFATPCAATPDAVFAATASVAALQDIVSPPPGQNPDQGCRASGLGPNGDGFLSIRSGPGTDCAKLGELRNGDAANLERPCANRWCYVEDGEISGNESKFHSYIYNAWCQFYP